MVDKEKISGLVDGEMDERNELSAYNAVKHSSEALETWRRYHIIRDVVRAEAKPGLPWIVSRRLLIRSQRLSLQE